MKTCMQLSKEVELKLAQLGTISNLGSTMNEDNSFKCSYSPSDATVDICDGQMAVTMFCMESLDSISKGVQSGWMLAVGFSSLEHDFQINISSNGADHILDQDLQSATYWYPNANKCVVRITDLGNDVHHTFKVCLHNNNTVVIEKV